MRRVRGCYKHFQLSGWLASMLPTHHHMKFGLRKLVATRPCLHYCGGCYHLPPSAITIGSQWRLVRGLLLWLYWCYHAFYTLASPKPAQEGQTCNEAGHNRHVLPGDTVLGWPVPCKTPSNPARVGIHHALIHVLPPQLVPFRFPLHLLPMLLVLPPAHGAAPSSRCGVAQLRRCSWQNRRLGFIAAAPLRQLMQPQPPQGTCAAGTHRALLLGSGSVWGMHW